MSSTSGTDAAIASRTPRPLRRPTRRPTARGLDTLRAFRPTLLVAALASMFGTVLVITPGVVADALRAIGLEDVGSVQAVLSVVGWVFLAVAVYVGSIVTANTCSTIIAGQTRVLALQRLVGATGAALRRGIGRSGVLVGVVGALLGGVLGVGVAAVVVAMLRARHFLPDTTYDLVPAGIVLPVGAVVVATWAAFRAGSRRVLAVTPLQALSNTVEPTAADLRAGRGRRAVAITLLVVGAASMLLAVALGGVTVLAVLPGTFGAFVSFSGVVVGAPLVMPPVLALAGRIGSRDPVVLLAGRNALRAPGRTARAVIGLVIGVTLLVTFAVALGILQHVSALSVRELGGGSAASAATIRSEDHFFAQLNAVVSALVGFSGVLAAVGVVNALALGVVQRRRELGLLRVLGLTASQVRRMIVTEAVQMVAAAVVTGLVLGVVYGWLAARTLLGTLHFPLTPVLPPVTVAVVVGGALLLAVVATVAPVRRAMRVTPREALAVD
ncbi:ABC transporter permease [Curtobacterium sp. MCBD17_019]|uniref:ABC transporter permease n=1 Tax=Curtobacterium sp. MCBD17_019 TaxID=2175669 RepID=UPI000DA964FF|nr:ABC transporter permease [Curtobacterium sp. MCBD17_019]PZE74494.1 ABC transporter permease [Curtobacterium sp. MCBD17_019]